MKTAKDIIDRLLDHYDERDIRASTGDAQDTALTELEEALLGIVGEDENDTAPDGELLRDPIMRNRLRHAQRTQIKAFIGREE